MSVVFDYLAGTPWVVTDEIRTAAAEARDTGDAVREAVARETTRLLRTDSTFRSAYRERFAAVDVASVTVDADSPREDILWWQARFDSTDWLHKITSPDEARETADRDEVGLLLNTQNLGSTVGRDVDAIGPLWNAGLRVFQLTYNTQNALGAGCYERRDGGLSNAGVDAVEYLNGRGGIVDLSHCGHTTTLDAIDVSAAPVACTHVACAAVADHPRAKGDDVLEALAEVDGYAGIVAVPWFLAPDEDDPDLDVFFEHVEHAVSILGPDRVGIGTDFGNVDAGAPVAYLAEARERAVAAGFPEGYGDGYGSGFGTMARYQDWPALRAGLEARFDDETARGILGENFFAFWERVRNA